MVVRGEGEADADLGDAPGNLSGAEVQRDAQCLDDVGGPALAGDGPSAVLDDPHPGGGGHQGGHGGDVDGVRAVAPGPHDVGHGRAVDGQGDDAVHEGIEHPAEFRRGLALGAQGGQEGRELRWLVGVVHDLGHRPAGVVRSQVLARQERGEQARPGAFGCGHDGPLGAGRTRRRDPASHPSLAARLLRGRNHADPERLTASLLEYIGHPAYGPDALRADLDRFTFLLGGNDGEEVFGRQ
jgi:hypothetical protein